MNIPLKCAPKGPIDYESALVQLMARHWTGNKPLHEPVLTKICGAIWHCYDSAEWNATLSGVLIIWIDNK